MRRTDCGRHLGHRGSYKHLLGAPEHAARQQDGSVEGVEVVLACQGHGADAKAARDVPVTSSPAWAGYKGRRASRSSADQGQAQAPLLRVNRALP